MRGRRRRRRRRVSEGVREEMTAAETDRLTEGGERVCGGGGVEGSSLSFPGMQPRDRLLQEQESREEQHSCLSLLTHSSSGPGCLGPWGGSEHTSFFLICFNG